jgi:hypothetical protein
MKSDRFHFSSSLLIVIFMRLACDNPQSMGKLPCQPLRRVAACNYNRIVFVAEVQVVQILLIIYVASGLILALISLPLIYGKIKPNYLYGFRVPATLENPDLWYPVNKYAAKRLLIAGLVMIAAAIGLYFWPGISVDAYAYAYLGVFLVAFSIVIIQCVIYLRRLQSDKSTHT